MDDNRKNIFFKQNTISGGNVLEKIKKFSGEATVPFIEKKLLPENPHKKNIWRVFDRVFVIGQMVKSSTEFFTYKNNYKEIYDYLGDKFKNKYLIWTFENKFDVFQNVQIIRSQDFNLLHTSQFCAGVRCWLEIDNNNVAIIELENNKSDVILFLLECLAIYLNTTIQNSVMCLFLEKDKIGNFIKNIDIIRRYSDYFKQCVQNTKRELENSVYLHQIIISGYPNIENIRKSSVFLRILMNNEEIFTMKDKGNIDLLFKDMYYIIFNKIDIDLRDDMNICIYYYYNGAEKVFFSFIFNGYCYKQGLFRFTKKDIYSPEISEFGLDFKMDLVFLESEKLKSVRSNVHQYDHLQSIKLLSDSNKNEPDSTLFEKYVEEGYSRIISKFCAQMKYQVTDLKNLIAFLESKGYKNISNLKNNKKIEKVEYQEEELKNNSRDLYFEEIKRQVTSESSGRDPRKIDLLVEKKITTVDKANKDKKKIIFKKKIKKKEPERFLSLVAIKPLYWTPSINIENSIFENYEDFDCPIDYQKFELFFCNKPDQYIPISSQRNVNTNIIDSKRLFLVSLAFNHLNKNKINHKNVYQILKNNRKELSIQELLNIERVFPTYEETFQLLSADFNDLSDVEKNMLYFSKLIEAQKIVKILIFEQKFFDDIFIIESALSNYIILLENILSSAGLKYIMVFFLKIGNTINYKYSLKQKLCKGFKLTSVDLFLEYKGKNNMLLLRYILDSVENKQIIYDMVSDLKFVHFLKYEDIKTLKDRINILIELYIERLETYSSLEYDKNIFTNLLNFVSKKLEEVKEKYKVVSERVISTKIYLCEDERTGTSEILSKLSLLITKVEEFIK